MLVCVYHQDSNGTHWLGVENWHQWLTPHPPTSCPQKALSISKALCLQDDAAAPSSAWTQEGLKPGSPTWSLPSRSRRWLLSTAQNVPGSTQTSLSQSLYPDT